MIYRQFGDDLPLPRPLDVTLGWHGDYRASYASITMSSAVAADTAALCNQRLFKGSFPPFHLSFSLRCDEILQFRGRWWWWWLVVAGGGGR